MLTLATSSVYNAYIGVSVATRSPQWLKSAQEQPMSPLKLRLLRTGFRLARVAPNGSGRMALRLFSTPFPRRSLSPRAAKVLAAAEVVPFVHAGLALRVFRWHATPRVEKPAPTIMLVHGWSSRAARFTRWVEPLTGAGFDVVAFDAPGHGASEGRRLTMPAYVEALAAVAERCGPVRALVGHSMGAGASVFAVAGSELTGLQPVRAEGLVLIAPPDSADDIFDRFAAFVHLSAAQRRAMKAEMLRSSGLDHGLDVWSSAALLTARPVPTLVVHDRDDEEVPFADGVAIAETPLADLHAVEGLGHHRIAGDAGVIARAVQFLASLSESSGRHSDLSRAQPASHLRASA